MGAHMRDANSVVGEDDLQHHSRKALLKEVFQREGVVRVCKPRMLAKAKTQETPLQVRRAAVDS